FRFLDELLDDLGSRDIDWRNDALERADRRADAFDVGRIDPELALLVEEDLRRIGIEAFHERRRRLLDGRVLVEGRGQAPEASNLDEVKLHLWAFFRRRNSQGRKSRRL